MPDDWLDSFDPHAAFGDLPDGFGAHPDYSMPDHQPDVIGTPENDINFYHHQDTGFTCAVASQQMVLNQFGINVSESQLVYEATSHGWLTDSGTSPDAMANLLHLHGVSTHHGANLDSLINELAHGHKVIVGLDSDELWGTEPFLEDWYNPNGANHAVVVTGVDLSDPQHPMVILNDPGHPDGAGKHYPMDQFLNAWKDGGHEFIATDGCPPNLAADPVIGHGFNPETGFYMDSHFWSQMAFVIGGPVARVAVQSMLQKPSAANTQGAQPPSGGIADGNAQGRTVESLTPNQREKLFYGI